MVVAAAAAGMAAAKLAGKALTSGEFSQAARMQRKLAMKQAYQLKTGKLGLSDPARAALLKGSQQQNLATQQAAQAKIAQQQAAAGPVAGGGYAAAQRGVAQQTLDANAQSTAQVNSASDQLAAQQRAEYTANLATAADNRRAMLNGRTPAPGAPVQKGLAGPAEDSVAAIQAAVAQKKAGPALDHKQIESWALDTKM